MPEMATILRSGRPWNPGVCFLHSWERKPWMPLWPGLQQKPPLGHACCTFLVQAFLASVARPASTQGRPGFLGIRLVTRTKKLEHISPVLYDLHWLTVKNRIIFKILLITFKALHGLAPGYLSDLITPYRPSRSLRSMVANLLILPKCRTKTYGERAFAVAGPTLWNSLPQFMRELTSVNQFKAHLKTYLFDK